MSALLKFEVQAIWQTCCSCGIEFGMVQSYDTTLRESHKSFFCPNGHSQSYTGKTEAQKVREEMQRQIDNANRTRDWALDQEKKSAKAAKEARKKLKAQTNRVEAGVCIHCKRTFQQLARHMQCKHSEAV